MKRESSESGCSRDQKQPCSDDNGPDGPRDALTARCKMFDRDGDDEEVVRTTDWSAFEPCPAA